MSNSVILDSNSTNVDQKNSCFVCNTCGKRYSQKRNLHSHIKLECGKEPQFYCPLCNHRFTRVSSLRRHIKGSYHNISSTSKEYSMLKSIINNL